MSITILEKIALWQGTLLLMAAVIDQTVNNSNIKTIWSKKRKNWWISLHLIGWPQLEEVSIRFHELFISVYGDSYFSFKRIFSSIISSIFFAISIYYLIILVFPDESYHLTVSLGEFGSCLFESKSSAKPYTIDHLILLIYYTAMVNVVPDMISVAETGFILKVSAKSNIGLAKLFIVDLFLTTAIWVLWISYLFHFDPVFVEWSKSNSIIDLYGNSPTWYSLTISTYSTSILWFIFVFTVVALGGGKRSSRMIKQILDLEWVKTLSFKYPVFIILGLPCVFSWPILFFIYFVQYLTS